MVRLAASRGRSRRGTGWPRRWRRRSSSRGRRVRRGRGGMPRSDLGGQTHDQGAQAGGDGRSTGPDGLGGPAAGDQLAVPAQDGGRCDQLPEASADREQSDEGGDQGAVGPGHPRARRAPSKHGELVAQDQDLDLFGRVGSGAQHDPAEEHGEHLIDQSQRHQRIMPAACRGRTARSRAVCPVPGTHRVSPARGLYDVRWPGAATGACADCLSDPRPIAWGAQTVRVRKARSTRAPRPAW
jgi:hypothetical protein